MHIKFDNSILNRLVICKLSQIIEYLIILNTFCIYPTRLDGIFVFQVIRVVSKNLLYSREDQDYPYLYCLYHWCSLRSSTGHVCIKLCIFLSHFFFHTQVIISSRSRDWTQYHSFLIYDIVADFFSRNSLLFHSPTKKKEKRKRERKRKEKGKEKGEKKEIMS